MKQESKYHLVGVCPLLQHNGHLADPLNYWSKAIRKISDKRKKTDADHEEIARLEWFGSLYVHAERIVLPAEAMTATLINAAKKKRKGIQAKAGLIVEEHAPLEYEGSLDPQVLWADPDKRYYRRVLMRVKGSGVMRTQPKFFPWAATIVVIWNDEQLNTGDIDECVRIGGEEIGLLEGRPRFGRYTSTKL